MLKKFYSLAIAISAIISVSAEPIDRASALAAAKAFMASRGHEVQLAQSKSLKAPRVGSTSQEPYYIFNATGNEGFVIVSGSDLTDAILGYSDHGHIDPDNMPDGLQALLANYEETIDDLDSQSAAGLLPPVQPAKMKRSMAGVRQPQKPFLTHFMGHKTPFNDLNPVVNDTICPAGCATVSICEVMAYYQFPASSPGIYGYTTATLGIKVGALEAMDFDWANMLTNYSIETYDSVQSAAVAWLIRHVGQAMASDFTTKGTAVIPERMPFALRAFGYNSSNSTNIEAKTPMEWDEIFYDNITKKMPVIISAKNVLKDNSGHAFILDGYDQDDFYHIDWGWSEDTNGYYKLTNLSPYNNTNSYTYMRSMKVLYNIAPKENYTPSALLQGYTSLCTNNIQVEDEDIFITRSNPLSVTKKFKFAVGLVNSDNQIAKVLEWDTLTFKPGQQATRRWSVNDLSGVRNGSYRLFPLSQLADGDGVWHFDACQSDYGFVKVDVKNGDYVMEPGLAVVFPDTLAVDTTMGFPLGAARQLKYTITNNTMDKFEKRLYLYADSTAIDFQMARVAPNSTQDLIFTYIPDTKGEHTLLLATDTSFVNVIASKKLTIGNSVKYHLSVVKYEFDNYDNSQKRLYGNSLRAKFTVKNDGNVDYNDILRLLLKQKSWHCTKKFMAHIPVGETREFYLECNDLYYAISYPLSVEYKNVSNGDSNIMPTTLWSRTFSPHKAICYWKDDGKLYIIKETSDTLTVPEDALAVYLFNDIKQPSSIVPNDNPNTLYYVNKKYQSLEGHNVIVKHKADSIVLVDSMSCYVPYDFKANHIKYTRTFVKGFNGKPNGSNWTTIALPFGVDSVFNTTDSVRVDWYRPGETEGKNFWVREFCGEDGFYTYFADADSIRPNTPYIITVPDDYQGPDTCLVGKPLEFCASDADVLSGKIIADSHNYNFQATLQSTDTYGDFIYMLNEEDNGNCFVYVNGETKTQPFRGYFTSETAPLQSGRLLIASYIDVRMATNSIEEITAKPTAMPMPQQQTVTGVYTLTGTKVRSQSGATVKETLLSLPPGIYIINGRKYIK